MGVEQTTVIDFIGIDPVSGAVCLTIADALEWNADHLRLLQDKLNAYLAFVESGELYSVYPSAAGRPVVVTDAGGRALLFSRAPIPWARDAFAATREALPADLPAWRHVGLYAYRAGFLRRFPQLPRAPIEAQENLEQLRALWHGFGIAVLPLAEPLPPGVDTPEDLAQVRALLCGR
jgi:hypothetical protein